MATEKNGPEGLNRQIERSVAYPAMNLGLAVSFIQKLHTQLGKGPYSREAAAKGLGYSGVSGASARAVAALGHYGLLVRSGNAYAISDLAKAILFPTDDTGAQKAAAIARAAAEPTLFGKLIKKFQGQALPTLLENILMGEGVSHKTSKEVATIFKETLQYAGLIQNGVVVQGDVESAPDTGSPAGEPREKSELSSGLTHLPMPGKSFELVPVKQKTNSFADSGSGWTLTIASQAPISSEIKKALIDVAELLKDANDALDENSA